MKGKVHQTIWAQDAVEVELAREPGTQERRESVEEGEVTEDMMEVLEVAEEVMEMERELVVVMGVH